MTAVYKFWKNTSGIFRGRIEMLRSSFDDQDKISAEISYANNGNIVRVENMSKEDARALIVFVKNAWNYVATSVNTENGSVRLDIFNLNDIKGSEELVAAIRGELQNKSTNMVRIILKVEDTACANRGCRGCPFYIDGGGCAATKYERIDKILLTT